MFNAENLISGLSEAGLEILYKEPLSKHSSFRIGGEAAYCVRPSTVKGIIDAVNIAKEADVRYCIVGNGSNILFCDAGYNGLIILTSECNGLSIEGNIIKADCGLSFTRLAAAARDAGLSGLEFAYGIPGTVGGAVFMNAGAYGGETAMVLRESTAFDAVKGETISLDNTSHSFGYRTSIYAKNDRLTVLSAVFELTVDNTEEINRRMNDFMSRRREKQPLEYPSAGSTFKRPPDAFAGKLIEDSGLKGYAVGGAQVSEKHAGFIINRGGATSYDVLRLIDHIQKTVLHNFNTKLECEIKYIE